MRLLRVLPGADADVDEAADYYVDHAGLEAGLRFLRAVREAYNFICENPEAGRDPLRALITGPASGPHALLST